MLRTTRRGALSLIGAGALARLARPAIGASYDADLIVIGAGLSGLHAAQLAQNAGMKVILLEAAARAGGRVLTLHDVAGAPNAGASQIGASYARTRKLATSYKLDLANDAGEARDVALSVGGRLMSAADWAKAAENPFPAPLKPVTPGGALFRLAGLANPLKTKDDWHGAIGRSADVSAAAFLRGHGLDDAGLRLADIGLNANALSTYSMLNVWRTMVLFREDAAIGPPSGIKGGTQRLTDAMVATIGDLRLNSEVTAICVGRSQVSVTLAGGRTLSAPFAICTLPFSVLRKIGIEGSAPAQRAAIDALPYTQIAHIYFEPATRFWESDGFAPDTWTDGPLERLFAVRDRETAKPNGLLLAWLNGDGAAWIKGKSDDELAPIVAAELAKARPAAEGAVKIMRTVRWTDENAFAGGAYMHFAPGQVNAWADTLAAPTGGLHFAGEHLSRAATGVEGALESAEAAVRAVTTVSGR